MCLKYTAQTWPVTIMHHFVNNPDDTTFSWPIKGNTVQLTQLARFLHSFDMVHYQLNAIFITSKITEEIDGQFSFTRFPCHNPQRAEISIIRKEHKEKKLYS